MFSLFNKRSEERLEASAALAVQAAVRGNAARKKTRQEQEALRVIQARARMRIDDILFKRYEKEKEQAAVAVQKAARGRDARKAAKGKATTATTAKAAKGAAADQQKGAAEAPLRPEDISQQDMLMIQVESAAEALAASQEEAATYKQGWEALIALAGLAALPGLGAALAKLPQKLQEETEALARAAAAAPAPAFPAGWDSHQKVRHSGVRRVSRGLGFSPKGTAQRSCRRRRAGGCCSARRRRRRRPGGAKKAAGKAAGAKPSATPTPPKRPASAGAATKAGGKPAAAKPAAAAAKPAAAGGKAAAAGKPAAAQVAGGGQGGGWRQGRWRQGRRWQGGRRQTQSDGGAGGGAEAPAPAPPKPPPPPMTDEVRKVAYAVLATELGACDAKVAAMEAALAERHALIAGAVTSFSAKARAAVVNL